MSTLALPAVKLPNHLELPETDGSIVQNFRELPQSVILTDAILPVLHRIHPQGDFALGQDCGIYWRVTAEPLEGCKCPDWFYVPGVPATLDGTYRRSYVLWQEIVPPLVLLEFVSGDGSEERDRTPFKGKFWIYEQAVRAGFYGIFTPATGQFEMYHQIENRFVRMEPNLRGHFEIPPLGVELGVWHGYYLNENAPWLRFYDSEGSLLPLGHELAEEERRRADQEARRADQERQRADSEQRRAERLERELEAERRRLFELQERLRHASGNGS